MKKIGKLKLIAIIVLALPPLTYYFLPIAMVYLITDMGKSENMKIVLRPFSSATMEPTLPENAEIKNLGLIKAYIGSKNIIKETQKTPGSLKIEYTDYIFISSEIDCIDPRLSFDATKQLYSSVPSDVLKLHSPSNLLNLLHGLNFKAIVFGLEPDKLFFIDIIDKENIKGTASFYQYDGRNPRISLMMYGGEQYLQEFGFHSKTNDTRIIKTRYQDFVSSMQKASGDTHWFDLTTNTCEDKKDVNSIRSS